MTISYAPIWEQRSDPSTRLLIATQDFLGKDDEEARKIALGGSLVEGVILGLKWTGEVLKVEDGMDLPRVSANLGGVPVLVIAGPTFDQGMAELDAASPTVSPPPAPPGFPPAPPPT